MTEIINLFDTDQCDLLTILKTIAPEKISSVSITQKSGLHVIEMHFLEDDNGHFAANFAAYMAAFCPNFYFEDEEPTELNLWMYTGFDKLDMHPIVGLPFQQISGIHDFLEKNQLEISQLFQPKYEFIYVNICRFFGKAAFPAIIHMSDLELSAFEYG